MKPILFTLVILCTGFTLISQNISVTGTIKDEQTNEAIIGCSILLKNSSVGTITDIDGVYNVSVPKNGVLIVSYVGYKTQEINVEGKTTINVTLQTDALVLGEVVVVGYGSVKKSDLTGSVTSLGTEAITQRNVTNPLEAIQGNMPGVQITNNSGRIGDGFNVNIRGTNSLIGQTQPLYIVDGVPTGGIDFLNHQDIARIDVLKDASSAAIYGSRGASGVIIVTTKSGKSAQKGISVSFETSYGVKDPARLPQMMSGQEWWAFHQAAYLNVNNPLGDTPAINFALAGNQSPELVKRANAGYSFDWFDFVLKSGIQKNNYVSISGRSEGGLSYNLGLGLQNETGNIDKESLDKYTFKAGVDHKLNSKFSMGANFTMALTEEQLGSELAMQEAFRMSPLASPWAVDADGNQLEGTLFFQPGKLVYPNGAWAFNKTSSLNPAVEIANSSQQRRRLRNVGNLYLEYKPISWLTLKTNYSAGLSNNRTGEAYGAQSNAGLSRNSTSSSEIRNSSNFNYTWDNQFDIAYSPSKDHTFNFLGLQSLYSNRTETSFVYSAGQPFETDIFNIGSGSQATYNVGSSFVKNTLSSYAARLNYAFKDKYLLTASNRWDGSSVLSEGNKWEFFPSVALGWKISEESFLKNIQSISSLKARASIGYTGNDNVNAYTTQNALTNQTFYDFNGVSSNGWIAGALANSQLSWEKTRELNFGLDFGLFNYRVTGSIDVYDRLSDNLIAPQTLPKETGAGVTFANVGSVSNKGVEVLLTTKNIQSGNISWETTFTFTKNTNALKTLYGQDKIDDIGNNWFIGENLNSYFNYVFDGIWQASEVDKAKSYLMKEGEAKPKDLDNNGKFDANDRTILGNTDPTWSGGITSNLRVGNFDFVVSSVTSQGVLALSSFHDNFFDTADRGRQKYKLDSYYVPANGAGLPVQVSNTNPRPGPNAGAYYGSNFAFYRDASFSKIKNIAVGYTLSDNLTSKLKIKSCRIYGNILNPFVFTEYEGYDPEWAKASLGVNRVGSVTYQMGLSLKF
jgi:TonB-linked SusC/RagA family outer membrane protein